MQILYNAVMVAVIGLAASAGMATGARAAIQNSTADASHFAQGPDEADGQSGEAEAKLIISRDIMPVLGNLVIARLRWPADPVAGCAAANRAESAVDVVEQNIGALRRRLVAENGDDEAVQEMFGDMPNLRLITTKATAGLCGQSPPLTVDEKVVFNKAADMAEVFFARLAGAANATVRDDYEVSCQNLHLARTTGSDLQSYLLIESRKSKIVSHELGPDGAMKFFSEATGLIEEGVSDCDAQ